MAPPQVPVALTRAETFDDLVRDSADRLERRWPSLADVEFQVQQVPPADDRGSICYDGHPVPLGRVMPATPNCGTNRIVIYRRPVEIRARRGDERATLVHEVVVEQVAELLGLSPETVDPQYGED